MAREAFRNNVLRAHELLASRLNGNAAAPLHQQRVSALQTFLDQGVPTTRHEEWKYTNVLPFIGSEFVTSLDADTAVTAYDCARAMKPLMVDGELYSSTDTSRCNSRAFLNMSTVCALNRSLTR
jgi:Fe-S cluster assembly protein SufD